MSRWPALPIRRQFRVINGGTPTAEERNWGGGVPWATPADLSGVNAGVLGATERTLTEDGLRSGSNAVPSGSLVLSTRAPIGYVAETSCRTAFNQGCRGLVPAVSMNVRYFRYQLTSLVERLGAWGQGSTFVELSSDALAAFPVVVPPTGTQQAIADYLDHETTRIDNLIAAKQQMAALLDDKRRSTIASKLMDLDSRMVLLGHAALIRSGAGFPHEYQGRVDGELPFYKVADLADSPDGRTIAHAANWIDLADVRQLRCRPAPANAILFPKVGAALLGNQRRITTVPAAFDNNLMAVIPRVHDPRFLRYWLTLVDLGELANPGPVPSINEDVVGSLRVPMPPLALQSMLADELDMMTESLRFVVANLGRQIDLISQRRNSLITAAVTGQLAILDAA